MVSKIPFSFVSREYIAKLFCVESLDLFSIQLLPPFFLHAAPIKGAKVKNEQTDRRLTTPKRRRERREGRIKRTKDSN